MNRTRVLMAAVLAASLAGCRGTPEPAGADARKALTVNPEQRAAVITEMNTMLRAVNAVLAAGQSGDTAAIAAAARSSGTAAAVDPALERILPADWKAMAEAVHGGFDSLGIAARGAAGPAALRDSALTRLSRVTSGCVACHATYRLTTR